MTRDEKQLMLSMLPTELMSDQPIITDPFGSYTGLTREQDEKPVQDADDL